MLKHDTSLARASSLANAGKFSEALAICQKICRMDKNNPDIWMMLGALHGQMNNTAEAISSLRKAIALRPGFAEAHYNLGFVLWTQGSFDEALASLQQAVTIKPQYAEAWIVMGSIHGVLGRLDQAEACCRRAIQLRPISVDAYINLANTLLFSGRLQEAAQNYHQAVSLAPPGAQEAAACCGLGTALQFMGKPDEALMYCERALKAEPRNVDAITLAATIAGRKGDTDRADQLLSPLIEAGVNHVNVALAFSDISKSLGRQDEAIAMMERMLGTLPNISANGRRHLHFQLGKLYDAKGEYDKAFAHYQQGNALKPLTFDPQSQRREMDTLMGIYSPEFMARMPRASIRSERPVFIVGMVRSGTSLVEQILASHPKVFGAGELPDIIQTVLSLHTVLGSEQRYPQCLPLLTQEKMDRLVQQYLGHLATLSPDTTRVIDKMPGNFMHLGLIELLFPDARVIHCMRDPLDTCLSAYFQDFTQNHPYCYDLYNLGAYHKQYQRLMQHWRQVLKLPMLEVQYEELVANQETVTRRMVEFCGLEWDERCLQFHQAKRYVATASYDQVRQPLYNKSAGRWKHYERYLEPLRKGLRGE